MDLTKILAISGKPGLYSIVSEGRNSIIVESLIDGKRFPAYATQKISNLGEIAVFTTGEERPLSEVFKSITKVFDGQSAPDANSEGHILKTAFEKVLPDYDKERVYVSDMKKIFSWFNLLLQKNMLNFEDNESPAAEKETANQEDAAVVEKNPAVKKAKAVSKKD